MERRTRYQHIAGHHKDIDAVRVDTYLVPNGRTGIQRRHLHPCPLVYLQHMFAPLGRGDGLPPVPPHLLQFHLGVGRFQLIFLRKYPHLYVGKGGVSVMIIGVMHHSAPCAYDLRLAGGNGRNVADVVTVVDSPFGRDEHDFHIVVGVRFKAFAAFNRIVVQHSKRSEVDTARIVVICKTEGEIALQPTVVGKPPAPRTVNYFLHMYSIYDTTKYKNRSTRIKRGRLNTHPDN